MECLKSGCTLLTEFFIRTQRRTAPCDHPHYGEAGNPRYLHRHLPRLRAGDGRPGVLHQKRGRGAAHTDGLVRTYHTPEHPTVRYLGGILGHLGHHAGGLPEDRRISRATGIPYSMHTLETQEDNEVMLKKFGAKVVPVMEKTGFFSPDFLAVHCVNLTEDEIDVFKKYDVKINYNPMANAYLGSGIPLIASIAEKGPVHLHGYRRAASNNTSDMMETLKMGLLLQKKAGYRTPRSCSAQDMLDFVTCEGAKCVRQEESIGSVEAEKTSRLFPSITPII